MSHGQIETPESLHAEIERLRAEVERQAKLIKDFTEAFTNACHKLVEQDKQIAQLSPFTDAQRALLGLAVTQMVNTREYNLKRATIDKASPEAIQKRKQKLAQAVELLCALRGVKPGRLVDDDSLWNQPTHTNDTHTQV